MAGIERRLVDRVGSFLRNVERTPGVTCGVCTAPTDGGTECSRCRHDRERFGELLADLVVPVAYGGHNDQSRTLLHGYKDEVAAQPGDERRLLVLLLLWVAVQRHRRCIERRVQAPLQLWTTVPSTKGREHHPPRDI